MFEMKIYIFALLVVAATGAATVAALPAVLLTEEGEEMIFSNSNASEVGYFDVPRRVRRFTCDVLSFTGHTACAIHCLLRAKTGGRCTSEGVCWCREKYIPTSIFAKNTTVPLF